jgi:hypothetical protein
MIQVFPRREGTLGTLSPLCPGKTMPGMPTLDIPPVNLQDQEKVKSYSF